MRGREAPTAKPRSGAETPSHPQSPLRITHDGEFYARLLTRESSLANPSFRYYGAGPAAVPFGWESRPGTPKDASCRPLPSHAAVPAITPPPSYHARASYGYGDSGRQPGRRGKGDRSCKHCCGGGGKKLKWIKIGFLAAVFRRIALGRSRVSSASPSSSAASVQSSSSSSTRWLFSGGSSSCLEEEAGGHHYRYYEAPAMTTGMLCLGGVRPSPWMVKFCGGRREAVWVQGWP